MNWNKVRLFGFRATVEKVEEKIGRIFVPENRQMIYQIGRVVCVGDCTQPDGTKEDSLVQLGDLVFFQTNAMIAANQQYEYEGNSYLNLHQGDLIGTLSSNDLRFENFTPLGRWVFAEPFTRQNSSGILLPETANEVPVYFKVAKVGSRAKLDVKEGQEVIINVGRANRIDMRRTDIAAANADAIAHFVYLDRDFVLGAVGEEDEKAVVTA
jgi:co-chaperonin GroES (HSP10)